MTTKTLKKLTLNKEVIARLSDNQLKHVLGGASEHSANGNSCSDCPSSYGTTCFEEKSCIGC